MLNQLLLKIQLAPKLLLGFVVLLITLIVLLVRDPPTSICDIQMQQINAQLARGFFENKKQGSFGAGVMQAFDFCVQTNSPGACFDIFSRLKIYEKTIRSLPQQCGGHPSALSVRKALQKALKLFVRIAWGASGPESRYKKEAWLEADDLGLFCRMKRQYSRLYGRETWKAFAWSLIPRLPEAKKMTKKDMWEKSLFSYQCHGLY